VLLPTDKQGTAEGRSVASVAVNYEAADAFWSHVRTPLWDGATYVESVQTGVSALTTQLQGLEGCSGDVAVVLIGYSQGADVIKTAALEANVGPLRIPDSTLADAQVLFLSDILPTGYQAALNAGIGPGSTLAIVGAGPVGLMAAAAARMLGAERIFMVDHHPYRLEFAARTYGVEAIDFDERDDAGELIVERTDRRGVDASIDAVGFEVEDKGQDRGGEPVLVHRHILTGVGVVGSSVVLHHPVKHSRSVFLCTIESHVFEEMRKPGNAGPLVSRTHSVNEV
jgi:hypothetical protein